MDYNEIIKILINYHVSFADGLIQEDFEFIQEEYQICFPPDLKELLSIVLPTSQPFYNWRDKSSENIKNINSYINWPYEGILYDILNNSFWYQEWGEKPIDHEDALNLAKNKFSFVPKLIPIYSHRYIPMEPMEIGNPIYSVYQTDIIYYGENLLNYFKIEFGINDYIIDQHNIKKIKFWDNLVKMNEE